MNTSSARRIFFTSAKWLLSIGMLGYVLHEIDTASLSDMLTRQQPVIVLGAAALVLLQLMVATLRWQCIVRALMGKDAMPYYREALRLNLIGMFFNCCLPGTIGGDAVRGMMLRSDTRSLSLCLHSVIIDRLSALVAVFVMVVIGLPWLAVLVPALPVMPLVALFGVLVVASVAVLWIAPRFTSIHIIGKVARLFASAQRIVFSPRYLTIVMSQAIAGHVLYCLATAMLIASLGEQLSLTHSLLLMPLVLFITTLPISIGGWGVRELGMVGLLALAGVSKHAALAASVQLGILQIIVSLPGAWLYLQRRDTATGE